MNELNSVMEDVESKELSEKSNALTFSVVGLKILTSDQYELAAEKLKEIKGIYKRLDEKEKSFTSPLNQAKTAIIDFFRKPKAALDSAEKVYKSAMVSYNQEQERIAREAQARLDEQARKEREKLEEQARKAAEKGKTEKSDILLTKAALVSAPVVQPQMVKVAGTGMTLNWDFEVVDESLIPREYMMRDDVKIRRIVKALKSETKIPGIKAVGTPGISSRSN